MSEEVSGGKMSRVWAAVLAAVLLKTVCGDGVHYKEAEKVER